MSAAALPPGGLVRHKRLSDQIYEMLRDQLRSGEFGLDVVFTEPMVAEALNTSRTPVREALFRLTSNGLLVERGRGYRLPTLSGDELRLLLKARVMVEVAILRSLVSRLNDENIAELRAAVADERAAVEVVEAAPFVRANTAFRDALFAAAENPYLVEMAELFNDRMQAYRVRTLSEPANRKLVVEGHARLVDALAVADEAEAVTVFSEVMTSAAAAHAKAA